MNQSDLEEAVRARFPLPEDQAAILEIVAVCQRACKSPRTSLRAIDLLFCNEAEMLSVGAGLQPENLTASLMYARQLQAGTTEAWLECDRQLRLEWSKLRAAAKTPPVDPAQPRSDNEPF